MDATNRIDDPNPDLQTELEIWDWARAAGVAAEDLRLALQALMPTLQLRKAA